MATSKSQTDELDVEGAETRPRTVAALRAALKAYGLNHKWSRLCWVLAKLPQQAYVFIDRPGVLRVHGKTGVLYGYIHIRSQSFEPMLDVRAKAA